MIERNYNCRSIFKPSGITPIVVGVFFLIVSYTLKGNSQSAIYSDKNQYFVVLPPKGWEKEEYPNETIRSKVAFHHPSMSILIRVTAEPTVGKDFSFDDLYTQHKVRQKQMRDLMQGGNYEMKISRLGDLRAVLHRNSYPNGDEHEMLSVVENGIIYTIGLNAASVEELNGGRNAFEAFLNSFTPLSKGKTFSKSEINAGLVAKFRRLAELSELQGKIEEAIEFVNQGLLLDSSNLEFKVMLRRLQSKK